jgi:MFS family permease
MTRVLRQWRAERERRRAPERGLVVLVRVLLLFESSLYSAVTPVLPHYAQSLGVSKPAVGLLAAAYSAGLIPGSVLGGWIAARAGVRRTTLVGLVAFAAAVAAFGFATDLVALDVLRVVQGVACGCIWGGALTWVIAAAPQERRGAVLGSVIGAAIFGTLLGPLLGTLAVAAGTELVFSVVGGISLALAVWVQAHPEPPRQRRPRHARRPTVRTLRSSHGLMLGAWLITLEAITIGATNTLLPLRLARFGASGVAIGATFVLASALSTVLAPMVGRVTDRHGARRPILIGLIASAALLSVLPIPQFSLALAGLSVIALGGPLTALMIPAVSIMTESAERAGIALVLATTLVNLAYATGETIGAPVAAVLSQATSDGVPLVALSALMLLTLLTLRPLMAARLGRPAATLPPAAEPAIEPSASTQLEPERPALLETR